MQLDKYKKGIKNPRSAILEVRNIYRRQIREDPGIEIMNEDWDNLIILDACRYDLFKEENNIPGKLSSVISKGSTTGEFLNRNFSDASFPDTVYISATPQVYKHNIDDNFYECFHLWRDNWDSDLRTVHPKVVTDSTVRIEKEHPNKRLIIHFIQPHYPFIGPTGQTIEHGTITGDGAIAESRDMKTIWEQMSEGAVDKNEVWSSYKENLNIALPEVERLIDSLPGKTIITSDHGNAFGEWGIYGHPGRKYLQSLVKVPWLIIDEGTRKSIEKGEDTMDKDKLNSVEQRLEDLGYFQTNE